MSPSATSSGQRRLLKRKFATNSVNRGTVSASKEAEVAADDLKGTKVITKNVDFSFDAGNESIDTGSSCGSGDSDDAMRTKIGRNSNGGLNDARHKSKTHKPRPKKRATSSGNSSVDSASGEDAENCKSPDTGGSDASPLPLKGSMRPKLTAAEFGASKKGQKISFSFPLDEANTSITKHKSPRVPVQPDRLESSNYAKKSDRKSDDKEAEFEEEDRDDDQLVDTDSDEEFDKKTKTKKASLAKTGSRPDQRAKSKENVEGSLPAATAAAVSTSANAAALLPTDIPASFLEEGLPPKFSALWHQLTDLGWYWKRGGGIVSYYYVRANCDTKKPHVQGEHYFVDEDAVVSFLRKLLDKIRPLYIKPIPTVPTSVSPAAPKRKEAFDAEPRSCDDQSESGSDSSAEEADPAIGAILAAVDPSTQRDIRRIPWKYLWKILRHKGWSWDYGQAHSNFYFAPGYHAKSKDIVMNEHKFDNEDAVRRFIRKQDWPEFRVKPPQKLSAVERSASISGSETQSYSGTFQSQQPQDWQLTSHRHKRKKESQRPRKELFDGVSKVLKADGPNADRSASDKRAKRTKSKLSKAPAPQLRKIEESDVEDEFMTQAQVKYFELASYFSYVLTFLLYFATFFIDSIPVPDCHRVIQVAKQSPLIMLICAILARCTVLKVSVQL
jgi:hypothetical protein